MSSISGSDYELRTWFSAKIENDKKRIYHEEGIFGTVRWLSRIFHLVIRSITKRIVTIETTETSQNRLIDEIRKDSTKFWAVSNIDNIGLWGKKNKKNGHVTMATRAATIKLNR
jgi:hypothetical protein